jgi:hypothetical protein
MSATRIAELIDRERQLGMICGPFERHWLLETRSPEHVRRVLKKAQEKPDYMAMARQTFASMDTNDVNTAAFSARNTSAAELNIIGDTISGTCPQSMLNQFCAIPANDPRAGKVYQVEFGAIYSNTGTPTIIFTPRWGTSPTVATNISLGASGMWTTITGTTNLPIFGQMTVAVRTAPPGATLGTVYATGTIDLGIPVTSSQFCATLYVGGGTAATTVDTSGQGAAGVGITMNVTWGTSSASNTLTTQWWIMRSLN